MVRRLTPRSARAIVRHLRRSRLCWRDFADLVSSPSLVGRLPDDPLAALGVRPDDLSGSTGPVQYVGKTRYLSGANAVVTHTVDDARPYVPECLDAMDKYGIKATAFVDTETAGPAHWARLRLAIANGHEVGAHSRRHPCRFPDTAVFCFLSFNRYEIVGSRLDILEHTDQPYVWSWAYPCGNCAGRRFVQRRVARAGYVMGRAYPQGLPDLQTYDANPYAAGFTQVVEKSHEVVWNGEARTIPGWTDVPELNAKFDEIHAARGIYSFVSHPQWLDYGPESFYERHLAHVGGREDVWYVPMGPLYAYRVLSEHTSVRPLRPNGARARYAVSHRLDPTIYSGSVTLEFHTSAPVRPVAGGEPLSERAPGPVQRWDGQYYRRAGDRMLLTIRPNTIVEFR
jgi:hypothetical protein